MSYDIPVLLITYKRFDSVVEITNLLKQIGVTKLYVSSNAPNLSKNPGEKALVEDVRSLFVDSNWEAQLVKKFRVEHLSAKDSIKNSIDWFFDNEEFGIILEDDTLPHPSFFQFIKKYLVELKEDDRYGVVCGYNLLNRSNGGGVFASHYPHIWGWGTWRRVWKSFDIERSHSEEYLKSLFGKIKLKRHQINNILKNYRKIKNKIIDTWDMQFGIFILENNYLCIYPENNLVKNIGFDNFATNTCGIDTSIGIDNSVAQNLDSIIVIWKESDRLRFDKEIPGILTRMKNKILKICKMS